MNKSKFPHTQEKVTELERELRALRAEMENSEYSAKAVLAYDRISAQIRELNRLLNLAETRKSNIWTSLPVSLLSILIVLISGIMAIIVYLTRVVR